MQLGLDVESIIGRAYPGFIFGRRNSAGLLLVNFSITSLQCFGPWRALWVILVFFNNETQRIIWETLLRSKNLCALTTQACISIKTNRPNNVVGTPSALYLLFDIQQQPYLFYGIGNFRLIKMSNNLLPLISTLQSKNFKIFTET